MKRQRIVIYRLGSLGDTVVALPCFHKVAQTWPDAHRIVLTNFPVNSKAAPLELILREGGLIHEAISYPLGTRSILRLWQLVRQLRGLNAEVLVYLTPARGVLKAWRDWVFFKCCGFKTLLGVPLRKDLQKCRRIPAEASGGLGVSVDLVVERECERLARCLAPLGPIDLDDLHSWDLRLTERELCVGAAVLAPLNNMPYFAINMGGKVAANDWGLHNWLAMLIRLGAHYPETGLLIVGAAEDSARAQQVGESWLAPVINACGSLTPRESAAAMRHAVAFIGHDSGPLHLAAAGGIRCVGLFGNHNHPRRWHPRGEQHRIIHRMQGIDAITVAEVLHAVNDIVPRKQGTV